ncbi:MAG: Gfo/Idh/MocA family oxidoreductase [Lachnospiraceae bacterium]|nr:Gfo/Idh/MocA family oxidoreductase [Lachnospiraceae bacterium]
MRKAIICGTRFGQFYIEALRRIPDIELVGVLARGSRRSQSCAEHYHLSLFNRIEEIPGEVELACVAVKSEVMGGNGNRLALELMKRGIHVLFEQPIHFKEAAHCFRAAQQYRVKFAVADLYTRLGAVKNFRENVMRISEKEKPLYVHVDFATQVSYPLMHLLSELLPGLRNWKVQGEIKETAPFQLLSVLADGTQVTFRAHNEADQADMDGYLHLFFQITAGYSGGRLSLLDPHGPVLWQPRVHFPEEELIPAALTENAPPGMEEPNVCVLYSEEALTQREIFTDRWCEALREEIEAFSELIDCEDRAGEAKRLQKQVFYGQMWQQLMQRLGYPQIVYRSKYTYFDSGQLKDGKEMRRDTKERITDKTEKESLGKIREGIAALDHACVLTMLYYLHKNLPKVSQLKAYRIEELLDRMEVLPDYRHIVKRWLKVLSVQQYVHLNGEACYFETPGISENDLIEGWKHAERTWSRELGAPEVFDYFKENAMQLGDILSGEVNPALLLFPEGTFGLATALYSTTAIARALNGIIADEIVKLTGKGYRRILEIGGGTGATTAEICARLSEENGCDSYLFSDVSDFFLRNAEKKFAGYPWMSYCKLDIDEPFGNRTDEEADVVVAVGVLNNARDILSTLRQIRKVLRPEGYLFVVEAIGESVSMLISQAFMMTSPDDIRGEENATFIRLVQWYEMFRKAGFSLVRKMPDQTSELSAYHQRLFILQKREAATDVPS